METLTLIERIRLLLPLVDEHSEADRKGEKEKAIGLKRQVELEIQSIVAEIRLRRKEEGLPIREEGSMPNQLIQEGAQEETREARKQIIRDAREKEIKRLDEKTLIIEGILKKQPGNKDLESRIQKLKNWRDRLKWLNESNTFNSLTLFRRQNSPRPRSWF